MSSKIRNAELDPSSRPPPVPSRFSTRVTNPSFNPFNPVKPGIDALLAHVAKTQKGTKLTGDSPVTQTAPTLNSKSHPKQRSRKSDKPLATPAKPLATPGVRSRLLSPAGGSPALPNSGSGVASGSASTPLRQTTPPEPELAKTNLFVRVARRGVSLFKRLSYGASIPAAEEDLRLIGSSPATRGAPSDIEAKAEAEAEAEVSVYPLPELPAFPELFSDLSRPGLWVYLGLLKILRKSDRFDRGSREFLCAVPLLFSIDTIHRWATQTIFYTSTGQPYVPGAAKWLIQALDPKGFVVTINSQSSIQMPLKKAAPARIHILSPYEVLTMHLNRSSTWLSRVHLRSTSDLDAAQSTNMAMSMTTCLRFAQRIANAYQLTFSSMVVPGESFWADCVTEA